MTYDTDIAKITAGLTKAQRDLLTGNFNSPFSPRSYGQLRGALVRKGVFEPVVGLTPLGLAVRAHIQENGDGNT